MPATVQSVLAMSLFMQQITSFSQVLSNCVQEALSCVDSRCRLIKTDRFEFLIVVLLAGLKDAMQICGKLPAQETFVNKFAIKETDGALVFARPPDSRLPGRSWPARAVGYLRDSYRDAFLPNRLHQERGSEGAMLHFVSCHDHRDNH